MPEETQQPQTLLNPRCPHCAKDLECGMSIVQRPDLGLSIATLFCGNPECLKMLTMQIIPTVMLEKAMGPVRSPDGSPVNWSRIRGR